MEATVGQQHYGAEREQIGNALNIRDQSRGKTKCELATSVRSILYSHCPGSTRSPGMVDLAFLRCK